MKKTKHPPFPPRFSTRGVRITGVGDMFIPENLPNPPTVPYPFGYPYEEEEDRVDKREVRASLRESKSTEGS